VLTEAVVCPEEISGAELLRYLRESFIVQQDGAEDAPLGVDVQRRGVSFSGIST